MQTLPHPRCMRYFADDCRERRSRPLERIEYGHERESERRKEEEGRKKEEGRRRKEEGRKEKEEARECYWLG